MSSTDTQVTYAETEEVVHLELRIIDHNSVDDDEKDVDTDYSEGTIVVLPAKRCSLSHEDHDQEFSLLFDLSLTKKKLRCGFTVSDDGPLSDAGLLFPLRLQLVAAGLIHDDKRDDKEGDEDAEDMYEGLFMSNKLLAYHYQEHDDNDDKGEDIDMYEELNALFYEPDYIDEVVHRFCEIREQIMEDHWWYYFGGREVTREMLLEIVNQDYRVR
nr:hypothetical protein [Tanacetum cinerariifolium]